MSVRSFIRLRSLINDKCINGYKMCCNNVAVRTLYRSPMALLLLSVSLIQLSPFKLRRVRAQSKTEIKKKEKHLQNILTIADSFYADSRFKNCINYLKEYEGPEEPQIIWRLARALHTESKTHNIDKKYSHDIVIEAYELVSAGIEKWEDCFEMHKWYAILLDARAGLKGTRERVAQLHNVKKHLLRAVELNPLDSTTWHILGMWCYQISEMAWYQRKIAAALFGEPPSSSYEEALSYFIKAEENAPQFYSLNLLMLGKTYNKLGNKEKALLYLNQSQQYPKKSEEDFQAYNEATKLIHNLQ